MGLLYELVVETADATTTVQIKANSKEEEMEAGQEPYPGCRLALVISVPCEQLSKKTARQSKPKRAAPESHWSMP